MRKVFGFGLVSGALALGFLACIEPPPKIAAIPASGLALRLHVFGASALDAKQTFDAAKQNNKQLAIVREGGDGEVVIGLDNDSPKCVEPTALCSYKVAYRVRDAKGDVVALGTTTASANADRCSDLCARALNSVAVKVLEIASNALKGGGGSIADASVPEPTDAAASGDDAGAGDAAADAAPEPVAHKGGKKPKPKGKADPAPPAKAEPMPVMCTVGPGTRLRAEDAERRTAQVDALKRLNVLDQAEYDCLRKAYLDRL